MKVLCITDRIGMCPSYRARVLPFVPLLKEAGVIVDVRLMGKVGIAEAKKYDVVWVRRGLIASFVQGLGKIPTVFDFDDAVYCESPLSGPTALPAFADMVRASRVVLAGNRYLMGMAKKHGASNVKLLRTGVDVKRYPQADDARALVWTGSSSTLPFLEEIQGALQGQKVRIICDRFPSWNVQTEQVRWSSITETRLQGIGLAPLPDTVYTRGKCAFKIVQYMAAGLPVVASGPGGNQELFEEYGVRGYHVEHTEDGFRGGLDRLLRDHSLRVSFGRENRHIASLKLDVKVLKDTLLEAFREVT
jgi:hypothetical protein